MQKMEDRTIILRSVRKIRTFHINPCKQPNGQNYPWVKPVYIDATGNSVMQMSDAERSKPESAYYIAEDEDIVITDGTTFDLRDPLQYNKWKAIEHCDAIAPARNARDKNGVLIIDGDKRRYGLAEFWIESPGEESQMSVSKKKLISQAYQYIFGDSIEGQLTKCRLLGKNMRNAPVSDVTDFLIQRAEKDPKQIMELYTSSDSMYRILFIDAIDQRVIVKRDGVFMYGDTFLGTTDDAVLIFLKAPVNLRAFEAIRDQTYPERVREIKVTKAEPVIETDDMPTVEPKVTKPTIKK